MASLNTFLRYFIPSDIRHKILLEDGSLFQDATSLALRATATGRQIPAPFINNTATCMFDNTIKKLKPIIDEALKEATDKNITDLDKVKALLDYSKLKGSTLEKEILDALYKRLIKHPRISDIDVSPS